MPRFQGDLTMPKFILEITLGNAAMCFPADIARALKFTANVVHHEGIGECTGFPKNIRDINGNVIGKYEVI